MKVYPRTAFIATMVGFTVVAVLGMLVFFHMDRVMVEQHKTQFVSDTNAKLDAMGLHIQELSNHFSAYTVLPTFKLMRFSELSLNEAAVREDIRRLELYFLDLQRQQPRFHVVRFIGNDGSEVFKVKNATIQGSLGDLSQNPETKMALGLQRGEMCVTYAGTTNENYLTWWLPVYTSLTHRQGILVLDIDFDFFKSEIAGLHQEGRTYSIVIDRSGRNIHQTTGVSPNVVEAAGDWVVSRVLPLPGLDWRAQIYANPEAFLQQVTTIRRVGFFGLAPLSVLLLFGLWGASKVMQAEYKARHIAHHDTLTSLPNRMLFNLRLQQALATAKRNQTHMALMFVDLDNFKLINDRFGHDVGDMVLIETTRRMQSCVREYDTVARFGGDEFVVLLAAVKTVHNALTVADKIRQALNQPFDLDGRHLQISSSVGVALYPEHGSDEESLLRSADLAMYNAKESGRNNVKLYQSEMRAIGE